MDDEPLLSRITIPDDTTNIIINTQTPRKFYLSRPQSATQLLNNEPLLPLITTNPNPSSAAYFIAKLHHKRTLTQRSHSAPPIFTEEREPYQPGSLDSQSGSQSTPKVVHLALMGLLLYLIVGISIFMLTSGMFKGHKTVSLVDALYFAVVTLCTIGYGDIVPDTTFSKLFTCVFILVGFGFIDILLHGLVTYVLDRQEEVLLGAVNENQFNAMVRTYVIDKQKGRMRIRTKVGLALAVVIGCIATGTIAVHLLEEMSWVNSFYLSVTSVTTVGYGDYAFKTITGRCFAVVWLLVSTLAVARAFLYLTEFRIERRNRKAARKVLQKKMTMGDLLGADMDNDGSISKSEYVIYKLKKMGKIAENDIIQICEQFDTLENSHSGKITFAGLMESESD